MRLPFPERIPLPYAVAGATILACLQLLQHTSPHFTFYSFLFIVIATVTFNVAGGFTRPAGAYVFFYAVLGVIIGIVYKCYLGEPADSNLRAPVLTIKVFTGGIAAMLVAVLVSRKLTRKKPFLQSLLREKDMRHAAIGCLAFGIFLAILDAAFPHRSGSLLSAVGQLNRFYQMSVIIATIATIKRTNGRTGIGGLVLLTIAVSFCSGALGFSKEGMFIPLVCWFVAACSLRLRIRPYQIAVGGAIVYVVFHFLVPYSQYGRNQIPEVATMRDRMTVAIRLMSNLEGVREQYLSETSEVSERGAMNYYDQPQGFFDRLTMIGADDALINYASQDNFSGLAIIPVSFANWIPHFLWPNKPTVLIGNVYAHGIGGVIGEEDNTTGISFTPTGEAYQLAGWTGVFVVAPILWIMAFTLFDSLCGDVRASPWGILVVALFSHTAPEGMLTGLIYIMWYGSLGIVVVALTTAYVMPLIGALFAGPGQEIIQGRRTPLLNQQRNVPRRSTIPHRNSPLRPSNPTHSNTL